MQLLTRDTATELAIIIQKKYTGVTLYNSILFERKITISTFGVDDNFGVKLNTIIRSGIDDRPIKFDFVIDDGMGMTKNDIINHFKDTLESNMRMNICDNADKFQQFK